MKKNTLRCIALLLCSFVFSNSLFADVSGDRIFIPTKHTAGGKANWYGGSISTRSIAVSNGVVYGPLAGATPLGSKGLAYFNSVDNTWGVMPTGQTNNGYGIATDDNKNLLIQYNINENSICKTFRIYKAASNFGGVIDPTQYKDITLDISSISEFCRYFSASGNLWDGIGYIYMTNGSKAIRCTINATGTAVGSNIMQYKGHAITLPAHLASTVYPNEDYLRLMHNGKYMLSLRNSDETSVCPITVLDVDINWETSTCSAPTTYQANYYQMPATAKFKGHELYAHPYGYRNNSTNATTNNTKFKVAVIIDRSGALSQAVSSQPYNDTNNAGCYATVNAWCEFEQINENKIGLYMLSPKNGDTNALNEIVRYDITYETYSGEIVINETDAPNRQDAVLNWSQFNHPCSGYKVEYNTNYTNASGAQTTDYVTLHENITATTATLKDIYWVKSSGKRWERTYNFRITPLKSDGTAVGHPITMSLTPEFLAIPPSWEDTPYRNYPGYQKVQLFWKMPTYGPSPDYYNVYRDDIKINADKIINYNFLDTDIPAGKHYYQIEACYNNIDSVCKNTKQEVIVDKRDPRKTTYSIEQIYNYPIGEKVIPQGIYSNLSTKVRYKQGQYYKGNWYIAQQFDGNATADDYTNKTTAYGGVMRFSADSTKLKSEVAGRVIRFDITPAYQDGLSTSGPNVGIAMDEGGNIFIRRGGSSGANGNMLNGTSDKRQSFVFELGFGHIYLRNSDGSYNDPIIVDLSKCQISDSYGTDPLHGIYFGRTDYYQMSGNLSTIGGIAYLWISGGSTYRSNKIKLTRTSSTAITATLVDKADIPVDMIQVTEKYSGVENYVFPVKYLKANINNGDTTYTEEYRGDYIHQLRSRVYANVKPTNNVATADTLLPIYDTKSRINNAGGCTIAWNGEIFLITPQCTYSQNSGNFLVAMGDRTKYDASGNIVTDANGSAIMLDNYYADLSNPYPVAQFTQDLITDGTYNDANGNWLYAVHGKIENEEEIGLTPGFTDPGEANCVYIYQYIPGIRFAKYRLLPNNYFPPTPVDLVIDNIYASTEYNPTMDLIRYDGTAKFGIALNSDETSTTGNVTYDIESYTYTLQDANGNDVWTFIIKPDGTYTYTHKQKQADGTYATIENKANETSVTLINEEYTSYITDNTEGNDNTTEFKTHDAYFVVKVADLYRNTTYNSSVTVNYVNKDNVNDKHNSETYVDESSKNYTVADPTVEAVVAHKTLVSTNDNDGDGIVNDLDNTNGIEDPDDNTDQYRVELNVDAPNTTEPVSYYKVTATSPNGTKYDITDFTLMIDGSVETDANGNKVLRDYIPGDYDFDSNEGKVFNESPDVSTLVWYQDVPYGTYAEGQTPKEWTYTITAVYGGSNYEKIGQDASGGDASPTNISTGIEEVYGDVEENLRAYPIPAYTTLTVKASETIKSISIYNLTGSEVLYVAGNNDTTMQIDVQSLATGYYIMRVNNMNPIKIIKK